MADTARQFTFADKHERSLNARQRDVLALIAAGKTNAEIGEVLGMTLDGAKWNVSEILTKLGFATREEAAEYWRWRSRPASRLAHLVRGLLVAPVAKWVAGASAVAVVAVVAVAAGSRAAPPEPAAGNADIRPFYLEARESVAVVVGPEEPREAVFRWWYRDADHFRVEYERLLPWFSGGTSATVADGALTHTYDLDTNTVNDAATEPLLAHQRIRPTPTIMIGPAPADSMAGLMTILAHWSEGSEWVDNGVKRVRPAPPPPVRRGSDVLLGRNVEVIDYVQGTLWVDPVRMVILKHISGHFTVEVTRFEDDAEFDGTEFVLQPPDGALPAGVSPGAPPASRLPAGPVSVGTVLLPGVNDGSYVPGFVPEGWVYRQGGAADPYTEWVLRPPEWAGTPGLGALTGDYVRIEQARGFSAVPESIWPGSPLEPVSRGSADVAETWLADGGIVIRVSAAGRGAQYLDAVVAGMKRWSAP